MKSLKELSLACLLLLVLSIPTFTVNVYGSPDSVRFVSFTPTLEEIASMTPPFQIAITATIYQELGKDLYGNDQYPIVVMFEVAIPVVSSDYPLGYEPLKGGLKQVTQPGSVDVEIGAIWLRPVPESAAELSLIATIGGMNCPLILEGGAFCQDRRVVRFGTTPPPPPIQGLVVTMRTEGGYRNQPTSTYEQGEAVTITGQVLYDNKPVKPRSSLVLLEVEVPFLSQWVKGNRNVDVITDESGHFSIMPFAGHEIGEYRVHAQAALDVDSKRVNSEPSSVTFWVIEPKDVPPILQNPGLYEIVELYKKEIPEGPIRQPDFSVFRGNAPESSYGSIHNAELVEWGWDPNRDFVCAGYQLQVLKFLDGLRFSADPEKRHLLRGLEYTPLERGIEWDQPGGEVGGIGTHHAVVLSTIGTGWKGIMEHGVVLDPWPKQKPEVYSVDDFNNGWGTALVRKDHLFVPNVRDGEIFKGYPLTGGVIYVNPAIGQARKTQALPKTNVVVHCPVDVLLVDSQGRRAGMLPNGTFVQEFPVLTYRSVENYGTAGWYFGLEEGVYTMVMTGRSTGTFRLLVSGEAAGDQALDYGGQPISREAQATITLGTSDPKPALSLPDGTTIIPEVMQPPGVEDHTTYTQDETTYISSRTPTTYIEDDNLGNGDGFESIAFLGLIGIAVVLSAVFLYRRRRPKAVPPQQLPPNKAPLRVGQERYAFCEACGRRIPAGSPYCPECGDKQGV